jgi:drug/metabolite transporter (DMT)-like permease
VTTRRVGILCILLYLILSASQGVYLGSLLQRLDPVVLLVGSSGLAAGFFNMLQLRRLRVYACQLRQTWQDVLVLNAVSAVGWYSLFLALKYLEPAVSGALANAIGPLVLLALVTLGGLHVPEVRATRSGVLAAAGTAAAVLFLGLTTWSGRSGVKAAPAGELALGLGMALLCGVCGVGTTVFSHRLKRNGFPADGVMAARFFALLVCGAFLLPDGAWGQFAANWATVVVIAALGFIAPLYALQLGIARVDPLTVAILVAMAPAFAFAVQALDQRLAFSASSLVGIGATIAFSLWGARAR